MAKSRVDPDYWFLPVADTPRRPHYTTGNSVAALIDGSEYMADLHDLLQTCDGSLLISGWRVTNGQVLNPSVRDGTLQGDSFLQLLAAAANRGCSIKALLFNVPGTSMPGPFRLWHARENFEFAKAVEELGGEAILDSRLARVSASSHHQKFIVAIPGSGAGGVAYVGGIDVCLDRWDHKAHDGPPERQQDSLEIGEIETHTASQPAWHDVQVRVEGPAVAQVWQTFRDRWNDPRPANRDHLLARYRTGTPIEDDAPVPVSGSGGTLAVQVNTTMPAEVFPQKGGPGEATVARAHEQGAIGRAQHYIYIEDQYFWPCSLVDRLEAALKRGVRVLVVVARDYDAPGLSIIAKRLRQQVVDRLRRVGGDNVGIFHIERNDGKQIYLHSKLMIVDDCYASVGSANFNARSLTNDSELQLAMVDADLVDTTIAGEPQKVCRFAHELRKALWSEHLELEPALLADPLASIDTYRAQAPIAPSRRAHPHEINTGLLFIDPIAEYLTTLITEHVIDIPFLELPPGVNERSTVKLAVDTALRGPQGALLLKFLEELLNPDILPAVASFPAWLAATPARLLERARTPHETATAMASVPEGAPSSSTVPDSRIDATAISPKNFAPDEPQLVRIAIHLDDEPRPDAEVSVVLTADGASVTKVAAPQPWADNDLDFPFTIVPDGSTRSVTLHATIIIGGKQIGEIAFERPVRTMWSLADMLIDRHRRSFARLR